MKELQELARKLLTEGTVKVVVGWEKYRLGVRPVLITVPEQADRLVFEPRCVHNLATFLSPRRIHVAGLGKAAVVVKGCDARAVAGLIRESQLKREDVVVIGVRCGGVVRDPAGPAELTPETVADRCPGCTAREPKLVDHLVGELPPPPPAVAGRPSRGERLARLMAMSHAERWAFWREELARCVRCHACRQVCPMCFCERCLADKAMPQWIESSPHLEGNLSWQVNRMMHLAGRCVDCGECERACPAGIPLSLLTRRIAQVVEERFGHHPTDDPGVPAPIGTFRTDDDQEFIV